MHSVAAFYTGRHRRYNNATMTTLDRDTIAAIATPPGQGGIGIIRLSGPLALTIAEHITLTKLTPRQALYRALHESSASGKPVLDHGIVLFFPAPASFTGENVVELQAHGGPVILDLLLQETLAQGARLARPGEFSERAFLNDKIDLAQAEAIADLIASDSEQAARGAQRSLQGEFSKAINQLVQRLTRLRVYVEAALDFPEEEIDFISDGKIAGDLTDLLAELKTVFDHARQGSLLREGIQIAIAGRPNAGKSSLLNVLAGQETAIVTAIAGTTRDILKERIDIDGLPIHIIDTAGLRSSPDAIEKEGMRRAQLAFEHADRVLLMVDCNTDTALDAAELWPGDAPSQTLLSKISLLRNKIDVAGLNPGVLAGSPQPTINMSITENLGVDALKTHIKEIAGYHPAPASQFTARRRHLLALQSAQDHLRHGEQQLVEFGAAELLAEDLRQAQQALADITGDVTADALLGEIFSSFCIGK